MNGDATLAVNPLHAGANEHVLRAVRRTIDAWRRLTWKHWVLTPVVALAFMLPNSATFDSNFDLSEPISLVKSAIQHIIAFYCFLLAVTAVLDRTDARR